MQEDRLRSDVAKSLDSDNVLSQNDALESTFVVGAICPLPPLPADDACWQSSFHRMAVVVDFQALAKVCSGRSPLEDDRFDAVFRSGGIALCSPMGGCSCAAGLEITAET